MSKAAMDICEQVFVWTHTHTHTHTHVHFWLHPKHVEIPGPGTEPEQQH